MVINELGIIDGSGCIVVIGHKVMSGIWYKVESIEHNFGMGHN